MEHLFLNKDLSLLATEKGYKGDYLAVYKDKTLHICVTSKDSYSHMHKGAGWVTAPLYQQIIDWFREKHDIHLFVELYTIEGKNVYAYTLISNKIPDEEVGTDNQYSNSYYIALNEGIKEAFKLI
jgi:hypothetical protein